MSQLTASTTSTKPRHACPDCDGSGNLLLSNSWFTADGYRRERCGVCAGTGACPRGYRAVSTFISFQKRARANVKTWGGLKPPATLSAEA